MNVGNQAAVSSGLRWTSSETLIRVGGNTISMVVLTRLLTPDEFGLVALILPITAILGTFIDSGLSTAVVQKVDLSDGEASSVYWMQLFAAIFGSIAISVAAPWIAQFFGSELLAVLLWVLLIGVVIRTTGSVMGEMLQRQMQLARLSKIFISASLGACLISIIAAIYGLGPWAIVAGSLANSVIMAGGIWIASSWRPRAHFSISEAIGLLPFGLKILFSRILTNLNEGLYTTAIAKLFGISDLGMFTRARTFSTVSLNATEAVTRRITLPLFSSKQLDCEAVRHDFRKVIQFTIFVAAPAMMGFAVLSEPIILLVFGTQWVGAAQFAAIFCIFGLVNAPKSALSSTIVSLGHASKLLYLTIILVSVSLACLLVSAPFGLTAVAWSVVVSALVHLAAMLWVVKSLISYRISMMVSDFGPSLFCALVMALIVRLGMQYIPSTSNLFGLTTLILCGAFLYVTLAAIFVRAPLLRLLRVCHIPSFERLNR